MHAESAELSAYNSCLLRFLLGEVSADRFMRTMHPNLLFVVFAEDYKPNRQCNSHLGASLILDMLAPPISSYQFSQ